jgi:hypothetical protein
VLLHLGKSMLVALMVVAACSPLFALFCVDLPFHGSHREELLFSNNYFYRYSR